MNKLGKDLQLEILKTITHNDHTQSGLKYLVTLSEVSKEWYSSIDNYCRQFLQQSLFARGVQIFTDNLIKTASLGPFGHNNEERIKITITTAMLGDANDLTFSTIKNCMDFVVSNVQFTYSPFFITLLKKLLEHRDTAVEKYILTNLKPRLLKHSKAQSETTRALLESLQNYHYPTSGLIFIILILALISLRVISNFL